MPSVDNVKIGIIGAGFVGSTLAFNLMLKGAANELVLLDEDEERAFAEGIDLSHGVPFVKGVSVYKGQYEDLAGADIVVITARALDEPRDDRGKRALRNIEVFENIIGRLSEYNVNCTMIIVSKPVDILTYAAVKLSGLPPQRIIGTGTVLDTARFRYLLGKYLGVSPRSVHAQVLGIHGGEEIPALSLISIGGMGIRDYCESAGIPYDSQWLDEVFEEVRQSAHRMGQVKGRSHFAISLAVADMVESIVRDQKKVMTVSTVLEDFCGIGGVAASLPTVIGQAGAERVLTPKLASEEFASLAESLAAEKSLLARLNISERRALHLGRS